MNYGTIGSFDVVDRANGIVINTISWKCDGKANTLSASETAPPYISQIDPSQILKYGPIGSVKIQYAG